MLLRLLAALAVLAGKAQDMPRQEAYRIARAFGYVRGGSGGGIRRALNLRGLPAYNDHRPPGSPDFAGNMWRQNRNDAKARRRALRKAA